MKRLSATPDLHGQNKDRRAWQTHLACVKDFRPDVHIILGDFVEFDSVSTHPKRSADRIKLAQETAIAKRDLAALDAVLPSHCRRIYLSGNHEFRLDRHIANRSPEFDGLVETNSLLGLEQRGWEWIPYGELFKFGKARFAHGYTASKYHAAAHVNEQGDSIFYGHTHDFQAYSVAHGGNPHVGMSCGSLCKPAGWMHGRPSRWSHGFLVMWIFPNRNFIHCYVPIVNGKTVFQGKAYGG